MWNWIRNDKSSLIVMLAGVVLTIGMFLIISQHSITQLQKADDRLDTIVQVHNAKLEKLAELQHARAQRIISLQQLFFVPDNKRRLLNVVRNRGMAKRFKNVRTELEGMLSEDEEKTLLSALMEDYDKSSQLHEEIQANLLDANNPQGFKTSEKIFLDDFLLLQMSIDAKFELLGQYYGQKNATAVIEAKEGYFRSRSLSYLLLVVVVFFSTGSTALISRQIVDKQDAMQASHDHMESLVFERTKKLQEKTTEAQNARAEAEAASAAKSTFLANMSHELRTPLNAVLGFSEIMKLEVLGPMDEKYNSYPEHIHSSASHLLSMIEELLDISRVEAGKVELDESEIQVSDVTKEAVQIVSTAQSREASDYVFLFEPKDVILFADIRIFRQVLINLLSNSSKFSEIGTKIELDFTLNDEHFEFSVRDNGLGVSEEDIKTLFDPYNRSSSEIAHKKEGTGLGLPISQSLIQLHGGDLRMESVLGEGTKVTLTLPANRILSRKEDKAA